MLKQVEQVLFESVYRSDMNWTSYKWVDIFTKVSAFVVTV